MLSIRSLITKTTWFSIPNHPQLPARISFLQKRDTSVIIPIIPTCFTSMSLTPNLESFSWLALPNFYNHREQRRILTDTGWKRGMEVGSSYPNSCYITIRNLQKTILNRNIKHLIPWAPFSPSIKKILKNLWEITYLNMYLTYVDRCRLRLLQSKDNSVKEINVLLDKIRSNCET